MRTQPLAASVVVLTVLSLSNAQVARRGPGPIRDANIWQRSPQGTGSSVTPASETPTPTPTPTSAAPTSATPTPIRTSTTTPTPQQPTSSSDAPSSSAVQTPTTSAQPTNSSSTPIASTTQAPASMTNPPASSQTPWSTESVSTNAAGSIVTVYYTTTPSATSSSASQSATSSASTGTVGTKSIVGLVVAAVLAVIGIAGFIYWKLTRKRFSGYDDDADAIKWPELHNEPGVEASAMQPLPKRNTPGANDYDASTSTVDLKGYGASAPSMAPYYDTQSIGGSTVDLSRGPVESAQPQAYYDQHDDRYAVGSGQEGGGGERASGYYDPYAGPVPTAFSPAVRRGSADTGRTSPGPNVAYGGRAASPGPGLAYGGGAGRIGSPGPGGYGPRSTSPGPTLAYGGPGRNGSPGTPAYGGAPRSNSPGPHMAYGGTSPRSTSPGPNAAYGAAPYGQRAASPGGNSAYRTG